MPSKKAPKEPAGPPATWAELEPLISTVGLPPDQAEMAHRTKGAQSAVPGAAKALGLDEAAALKLFRQAMFKLRMEFGKSRKPASERPKAAKPAEPPATWKDLEPFLSRANLPAQEADVARRTQGVQKAVPEVAKALNLPEDQTLTLFRKAMFKIRMEYGRAKKEMVGA